MCAVQDVRNEGLARGGDLPFALVEKVLAECSPFQPVVDFIGGEPLLYFRRPMRPSIENAVMLKAKMRRMVLPDRYQYRRYRPELYRIACECLRAPGGSGAW